MGVGNEHASEVPKGAEYTRMALMKMPGQKVAEVLSRLTGGECGGGLGWPYGEGTTDIQGAEGTDVGGTGVKYVQGGQQQPMQE